MGLLTLRTLDLLHAKLTSETAGSNTRCRLWWADHRKCNGDGCRVMPEYINLRGHEIYNYEWDNDAQVTNRYRGCPPPLDRQLPADGRLEYDDHAATATSTS